MRKENSIDYTEKNIPLLTGRPERDKVINEEDITNLKIALGLSKSVDQFIMMV